MKDIYHINTEEYSLERFKSDLETRELIPSRVSLKVDLDERFEVIQNSGIRNLKGLIDALKTKVKIAVFSDKTGLPVEYLTLLRREANSYLPNPFRIDAFSGIPTQYSNRLAAVGIRNSRQLFNEAHDRIGRERLARRTSQLLL